MNPEFSEFSYGFAFTHEFVNRNPGLDAAPELPSLIREAETGTDLKLGYQGHPKYFQFKLSAYLNRKNAIHWCDHRESHYRVRITTRPRPNREPGTDQHSNLIRLAKDVDEVFYVAPKFHTQDEFNRLFLGGQITNNSLWAPLRDLHPVSDGEPHYLTFTRNQNEPVWHSEAVRLQGKFSAEDHYETISETLLIDEDFFRGLRYKLINALNATENARPQEINTIGNDDILTVLRDTYRLLTAQFGLRMVTLVETNGQQGDAGD